MSRHAVPESVNRQGTSPVWQGAGVAFALAVAAAVAFDIWYSRHLRVEARARVETAMAPTAAALGAAVERRVALLEGLWSFAEAQPSRERLDLQFPLFSRGMLLGTEGVRALQFVEGGRIVATWPLVGNEAALGYDLLRHPDRRVVEGVERGMRSRDVVVTGPLPLVQGGEGLLVRKRLSARPGFPDMAAIILDVPELLREAGLPATSGPLVFEVLDRSSQAFLRDARAPLPDGVTTRVSVPDGDWTLLAAPREGWEGLTRSALAASRGGSVGFIVAMTLLGVLVGQRQQRLRTALAEGESRLDVALRAGQMGTWDVDILNDRLSFDEAGAAILGRPVAECSGPLETMFRFLHPQDAAFVARVFLEFLNSDRADYTLEHRVLLPDGRERWVFVRGDADRDVAGKPLRVRGVIADASDRRAMESRARQLERVETVGAMAGGIAHDFNNLLSAMVSFTELAQAELAKPDVASRLEGVRADLAEVLKSAERARGLTRQLLAFSRGTTSEPRELDLRSSLADLEPLLRRVLGHHVTFTVELAEQVPAVWIDPSQFTQVVLNLLVNARDAIRESGTVTVHLSVLRADDERPGEYPAGEWIQLEVRDSGSGMPEDVRRQVFEPYFTTKPEGRGTGLGLSVVRGVVRASGGHAFIESELGKGSRAVILLPPFTQRGRAPTPVVPGRAV